MMITIRLGDILKQKGISVYRLSLLSGISNNNLHDLINGKRKQISIDYIDRLCTILEVDVSDIICFQKAPDDKT